MERTIRTQDDPSLAQKGYWPAIAASYLDEGKYSKAVELCLRMLERDSKVMSGRVILARALFHTGQYEQAREQFLEVLKHDPAHLVSLKYLGDLLFQKGEEAAALAYYRRVMEIDPYCRGLACPIVHENTVETKALVLKRGEESVEEREKTVLPEPAFVTETIGDIYRDQGYFELAEEVYRRLLTTAENSRIADKLREMEDRLGRREKSI